MTSHLGECQIFPQKTLMKSVCAMRSILVFATTMLVMNFDANLETGTVQ